MEAGLKFLQPIDYPHHVSCLDTEQLRPGLACCYLLRSGDRYAFVDCGTSLSVPGLMALLQRRGIAAEQVAYVMPTHVHLDHAGGAGELMSRLPQAQLVAHPRAARHLIDPAKLIEGATLVYGAEQVAAMYGRIVPVPEQRLLVATDGYQLDFNGRALLFLDAPGHARHHYAIWDAESRGVFTGDVCGLSYRELDGPLGPYLLPTTTPVQFEPEAWSQTLDRIQALQPAYLYLTHYGRLGNVDHLIHLLRRGIANYQRMALHHAAAPDRHARILEALTAHSLQELRALSCPLPEQKQREVLQFDLELNTQGLEVWLDRQKAA
jgi:glyoxylase-like metal-dependent hydrolase (beta-lactamase superfamily II)